MMCWFGRHDWRYHVHLVEVQAPPAPREYIPFRSCRRRSCDAQQFTCSLLTDSKYPWQDVEPRCQKPTIRWFEGDRQKWL